MKKTIYVETTIFSFYYDDRPESKYRQKVTRDWWKNEKRRYDLVTSFFVRQEVSNPVYPGWKKVAALAEKVKVLELAPEIDGIVQIYMDQKVMPANDVGDAAHLAIASFHGVD